jgi:hypothetical protein
MKSTPRPGPVPPVVLVALLAVGCSGSDAGRSAESTQTGAPVSARAPGAGTASAGVQGYDCADLITEREIDQVIGLDGTKRVSGVRGDENDVLPGHTECGYELPGNHVLGISVYSGRGSGEGLETFDFVWEQARSQGAESLSGIGESALIETDRPSGPRALARARDRGIRVAAGDLEGLGRLELDRVVRSILATVVGRV